MELTGKLSVLSLQTLFFHSKILENLVSWYCTVSQCEEKNSLRFSIQYDEFIETSRDPSTAYPLFEAILRVLNQALSFLRSENILLSTLGQPLVDEALVDIIADFVAVVWRFSDAKIRKKILSFDPISSESGSDEEDEEDIPFPIDRSLKKTHNNSNQGNSKHIQVERTQQDFCSMFLRSSGKRNEKLEKWIKTKINKLDRLEDDEIF